MCARAMAGRSMRAPANPVVCPWLWVARRRLFRCAGKKQFEPRPLESFGAPIGFALNGICPANARAMCRFPFQMRKFYPFLFFVCFDDNLFIQHAAFARKTTNFGGKIKGKAGDLWGHFMRQIYDIVID